MAAPETDGCYSGAAMPSSTGPSHVAYGEWVVMLELYRQRWGGDLRRAQIFRQLARRTGARVANGWSVRSMADAMGTIPFVLRALPVRLPLSRPRLAASEQLRP